MDFQFWITLGELGRCALLIRHEIRDEFVISVLVESGERVSYTRFVVHARARNLDAALIRLIRFELGSQERNRKLQAEARARRVQKENNQ